MTHILEFWPQYAQFVIYDVNTPYDADQIPLFNAEHERGAALSVRRREVSIALLTDASVRLELSYHPSAPLRPAGDWEVDVQTVLEMRGSVVGIRDVIDDQPTWTLEVPEGKLNIWACGRCNDSGQVFDVRFWPA